MSPRKFDRFMADVRNGTNFKLASLSHAHYRAFFSAVLPIAAMSKVRGAFMVNDEPATVAHMRLMSPKLTTNECRTALDTFRSLGLLEHDPELGAEWVHDFEDWNPEPKGDSTNADRQQRYRDRQRNARNGPVTGAVTEPRNGKVTPAEVKGREEEELLAASPPSARAREADFDSRAETVACPRCAAAAGEQCDGARGKRDSCHLERHHAVGELTHISGKAKPTGFSAPVSLAWAPSPEDVAMRDEHFPDWEVEAVANSAATLRLGRKPVTVEAVRGLLTGEEAA